MGNSPWKKVDGIQKIQIIGERCSGTNFLFQLLKNNVKVSVQDNLVWKHGFLPNPIPNSENILFIHIYRNIYDYLRSLYRTPHNCVRYLRSLPFSDWIRTEWSSGEQMKNMMYYDTDNGKPFSNVIQMRNAKLKHFVNLVDNQFVKFSISISYEKLCQNPQQFLFLLRDKFNISLSSIYTPVNTYKGENKNQFIPQKYFPFTQTDLDFINDQIDWNEFESKTLKFAINNFEWTNWNIPLRLYHTAPQTNCKILQKLFRENGKEWQRLNPNFHYYSYSIDEQLQYLENHHLSRYKEWKEKQSNLRDLNLLFGLTKIEHEGGYYISPYLQPLEPLDRYIFPEDLIVLSLSKDMGQTQCTLFGSKQQSNILDLYLSTVDQNQTKHKNIHILSSSQAFLALNWNIIRG